RLIDGPFDAQPPRLGVERRHREVRAHVETLGRRDEAVQRRKRKLEVVGSELAEDEARRNRPGLGSRLCGGDGRRLGAVSERQRRRRALEKTTPLHALVHSVLASWGKRLACRGEGKRAACPTLFGEPFRIIPLTR